LVLGGGGYTIRNVARCWAYETSVLLNTEIPNEIPYNDYFEYYSPDFELHLSPEPRENLNNEGSLEKTKVELLKQLQNLQGAPGVQMQEVPPEFDLQKDRTAEGINDGGREDDEREKGSGRPINRNGVGDRRQHEAEFYSGDDDNKDAPKPGF